MAGRILIIDDEEDIRFSLRGILEDEGHDVREAGSAEQGLEALDAEPADALFLDIWLPGMDGLEALERIHASRPDLPVVMISGHGTIETAVTALKKGAFDFIEKPLSLDKVVTVCRNALELARLAEENRALRARIGEQHPVRLTGESPAIRTLRRAIEQVAPTDAWVLITGENGTGKEIVARSIHAGSRRADKPLVAVNCAAIPEELIESELFGHEKGAFTGAETAQAGKFELADKGTLFLDEIGDMSLKTQAKSRASSAWAAARPSRWTRASSRRRTRTSWTKSRRAISAKTSTTGSRFSRWKCRPCANGPRTFPCSSAISRQGSSASTPSGR
jgi:two-component system nitrogen regulation response regulator NtrX